MRAGEAWSFERYAVPSGKRLAQLAIPETLTHGWPLKLSTAKNIVTVWCDDDEPYRFHIRVGRTDRLLDDEPNRNAKTPGQQVAAPAPEGVKQRLERRDVPQRIVIVGRSAWSAAAPSFALCFVVYCWLVPTTSPFGAVTTK